MKGILIITAIICMPYLHAQIKIDGIHILSKVKTNVENFESYQYNLYSRSLSMTYKDTLEQHAVCKIKRIENDEVLGYYFKLTMDTLFYVYGMEGYYYGTENSHIKVQTAKIRNEYILPELTTVKPYEYWIRNKETKISYIKNVQVNSRDCWEIKIERKRAFSPKNGKGLKCKDACHILFIDTLLMLPIKIIDHVSCNGMNQYKEYKINDLKCNEAVPDDLFLPSGNETPNKVVNYDSLLLSMVGKDAPDWSLSFVKDSTQTLSLSDLRGKIVLLDFWYIACFPCIKAIPEIKKLKQKYGDKLEIVSINSFDGDEISRIQEFIKSKKIDYAVLLGDINLNKSYNVSSYPAFYILDQKGVISYVSSGFGPGLVQEFSEVINKLLKE